MIILIILCAYIFGYWLSHAMLRIEHEAEKRAYTHGDRFANLAFSAGSFLTVLIILVYTWIKYIGQSGYWMAPVKPVKKEDAK